MTSSPLFWFVAFPMMVAAVAVATFTLIGIVATIHHVILIGV
jgi:hypothetical protein